VIVKVPVDAAHSARPVSWSEMAWSNAASSVQFAGNRALLLRVVNVSQKPTYYGWLWLTGYVLDWTTGDAVEKREIFVQLAGLRPVPVRATPRGATHARR